MEIPIIDLGLTPDGGDIKLTPENQKEWESLAEEIFNALSHVGFMYIKNHGIPAEKIDRAFTQSENFFLQSTAVKEQYLIDMKNNYRGYTRPGQQILSSTSFHEFAERFSIVDPDEDFLVPETPDLIKAMEALRRECWNPLRKLLFLIGMALKLQDESHFVKHFSDGSLQQNAGLNSSMVRTHYYPAIPEDIEIPPGSVRCSQHTDFGILTFLFQDSMGGLEVKGLDDQWISATPIPGSILVNTGDIMEFWTGGLFPATTHRVLIPKEEIQKRTKRQSMTYFVNPDEETLVQPLITTGVGPQGKSFEPVLFKDHYQRRLEASYKY